MVSSKLRETLIQSLTSRLSGISLWGVLDITFMKRRYEINIVAEELIRSEYFKEYGFNIRVIDDMCFVQKTPWFKDNPEFIEKHNLYFIDKPSYHEYLLHMVKEKNKHNEENV
jgi:hypothetical protein